VLFRSRMNMQRAIFLGALTMGGVVLAVLDGYIVVSPRWDAMAYLNLHTCLALLMSIFCLSVFGSEQPVFWRESASGISIVGFYLARIMVNAVDLLLQCFLFAGIYYLWRNPATNFLDFFVPFSLVSFAASGMGYFISVVLPPEHGPFIAALVAFVTCGLLGHPSRVSKMEDGGFLEATTDFTSLTRWSVGMSFLNNMEAEGGKDFFLKQNETERGLIYGLYKIYQKDPMWQEQFGDWYTGMFFLFGIGLTYHILGFLGLKFMNRDKQV